MSIRSQLSSGDRWSDHMSIGPSCRERSTGSTCELILNVTSNTREYQLDGFTFFSVIAEKNTSEHLTVWRFSEHIDWDGSEFGSVFLGEDRGKSELASWFICAIQCQVWGELGFFPQPECSAKRVFSEPLSFSHFCPIAEDQLERGKFQLSGSFKFQRFQARWAQFFYGGFSP
jgi:hypothetical protein